MSRPVDVLLIGSGAYVCGRGTQGFGTLLPAFFEARRGGLLASLTVAARSRSSLDAFRLKHAALQTATGVSLPYAAFPRSGGRHPAAWRQALRVLADPGAVVVATPDRLHHPMALAALKAGKHALVVKPLTPSTSEGLDLVREARARGLHTAVDYHKRWDWANLQLRRALREGAIGDPLYFHVEFSQQRWVPEKAFASWIEGTNVFQYLGVHYVDAIFWATGARPVRASAVAQTGSLRDRGLRVADAIQATVEWRAPASGRRFSSVFLLHWVDPDASSAVSYQSIKVIGTRGRFESDQKLRGIETVGDNGVRHPNPYFCQPYPGDTGLQVWRGYGIDSILQFLRDCSEVAEGKARASDLARLRPSFGQALVTTAVSEAVGRSLRQNAAWVPIPRLPAA